MRRFWAWYNRGLGRLVQGAHLLSAAFVLLLMVLVIADILGRYLLNNPVPMTYTVLSLGLG